MQDRQQDQDTKQEAAAEAVLSPPSVRFKLTAEFAVEASGSAEYLERLYRSPEERSLLLTILTTPEALNRMSRIGILTDFDSNPGLFENQFSGFDAKDILACVLPYLSDADQEFWRRSMRESRDVTGDKLLMILEAFETVLKSVVVEDMTTGERIPLHRSRPV